MTWLVYSGRVQAYWRGLVPPTWERVLELQHIYRMLMLYWAASLVIHQQAKCVYRQMRICAAVRELSRKNGRRRFPVD